MTVSLRPNLSPLMMTERAPTAHPNSYTATYTHEHQVNKY